MYVEWFFFFQAEDGIRDLVRSRGLGDVYKRQAIACALGEVSDAAGGRFSPVPKGCGPFCLPRRSGPRLRRPVSYTHLTLPTSDLV